MGEVQALTNALAVDPREETPKLMLIDALQESGKSPLAAKRAANKAEREARDRWLIERATELLTEETARGRRARSRVRSACSATAATPIIVQTASAFSPVRNGEPGRTEFKNGDVCKYPGAARRKGYKVVYIRSTLVVFVGARWVVGEDGEPLK